MAENSAIEWTDATFNPWIGCTKVSPGCDHCYAATQDKFRGWTPEGWGGPRKRTSLANWRKPVQWNAQAFYECSACGARGECSFPAPGAEYAIVCAKCHSTDSKPARRRVFCASLADVFDNEVPPEWRIDLWDLIDATPNLDWMLLTKRIGNVRNMVPARWFQPGAWPKHVRIGATIVNQDEADRDVPKLLALPCPNFLSMEPLLGPVDLTRLRFPASASSEPGTEFTGNALTGALVMTNKGVPIMDADAGDERVNWVIVGGESGPGARPMHPDWAPSLRDQCAAAGVPFLFKQHGEWISSAGGDLSEHYDNPKVIGGWVHLHGGSHDGNSRDAFLPGDAHVLRVGKKAAGRLLDGVTHDGFPEVQHG